MSVRLLAIPFAVFLAGCSVGAADEEVVVPAHAELFEAVDFDHPMFLQSRPGATCDFHPKGVESPHVGVDADRVDGRVRFFAPPTSWGSVLEVSCTADSSAQSFVVDMKDPTTFQSEPEILTDKTPPSVRPPLTGDLLAVPPEQILGEGYPPRPDPDKAKDKYEEWVAIVTTPREVVDLKWVAALGRYGSNWKGTYNDTETMAPSPAWTGRVYDMNGWVGAGPQTAAFHKYGEYVLDMTVPTHGTCPTGKTCSLFLWGGLGGWNDPAGARTGLIQSGVVMQGSSAATVAIEYFPDSWIAGVGSVSISAGDKLEVWGWSSPNSNCTSGLTYDAPYACYNMFDRSTNQYLQSSGAPMLITKPVRNPTVIFDGPTFESIVEKNDYSKLLSTFTNDWLQDYAFDYNGSVYHDVFSDPWIFVEGFSHLGHQVAQAYNPLHSDDYDAASFFVQFLNGE